MIIDDAVLSSIINGLYYPECPYEFSILPVEILGNIYEQFLGKIIKFRNIGGRRFDGSQNSKVSSGRTNTRHTALIEEKPEVKKAGGVYYTPQYIVRYIVENTIGIKIKGQNPEAIAQLKVVDPACGSGSFLVEAYQQLLNYHLDYYSNEKERKQALKNSLIYETGKNIYKLTIEEKQRILLNNIYGVDIDGQAVEVTKLSLYLKLLENEGSETQRQLFKFSDIKLLPSLDSNAVPYSRLDNEHAAVSEVIDFLTNDKKGANTRFIARIEKAQCLDNYILFLNPKIAEVLHKIQAAGTTFFEKDEIIQGIVAPQDFCNEQSPLH